MDLIWKRIAKIARAADAFTARTMRQEGIGSAEFDVIRSVRHHPGITQAGLCHHLEIDKGAAARRAASLETKGYLRREPNPADGRSQLLYTTEKADALRHSREHLEELFYEWLLDPLSSEERDTLARLLTVLGDRCREERHAGFPNVNRLVEAEGEALK